VWVNVLEKANARNAKVGSSYKKGTVCKSSPSQYVAQQAKDDGNDSQPSVWKLFAVDVKCERPSGVRNVDS
jgi:hypothetical protein